MNSNDSEMDRNSSGPERRPVSGVQRLDSSPRSESPRGHEPPPSKRPRANWLVRIGAVAVLACGGWYFLGPTGGTSDTAEERAPMYDTQRKGPTAQPATVGRADINQDATAKAREAALRGDPIPGVANASPEFVQAVKDGQVTFYTVRVYDTCAEDGDVVTLRLGNGADIGPIPLTIAGTTITLPVVAGGNPHYMIIGVKDGVGGITVGVQTSMGLWYSGVIAEGATEVLPIAVR
jgi:hypothetical protein